jgi:hypothetical protein
MGHNRWAIRCHRTERQSGRVGFHAPITREYANGPIWACSRYHCSRAVPVWPTQYWADTTCNPPALNECDELPKNPTNRGFFLKKNRRTLPPTLPPHYWLSTLRTSPPLYLFKSKFVLFSWSSTWFKKYFLSHWLLLCLRYWPFSFFN